ncbi:protein of unknown function [Magnetospirillum sp. XM-1]|uniref:hypothetical protein n=1 Tax=Magnetospirillum sp. XM-1 TaxID=1663591 RepID=UPI00073DC7BB|nr:hypothetical protein [Magnetospirillum sp. XM-1]CUW39298.1 protein of unknown function [Magnetospirillum sp. XM-1]
MKKFESNDTTVSADFATELGYTVTDIECAFEAVHAMTETILANVRAHQKQSGRGASFGPTEGLAWVLGELYMKVQDLRGLADRAHANRRA